MFSANVNTYLVANITFSASLLIYLTVAEMKTLTHNNTKHNNTLSTSKQTGI